MKAEMKAKALLDEREKSIAEAVIYMTACANAAPNWRAKVAINHAIRRVGVKTGAKKKRDQSRSEESKRNQNIESIRAARNTRQRWTLADDEKVLKSSMSDACLARSIGRSIKAVRVRRVRLSRPNG